MKKSSNADGETRGGAHHAGSLWPVDRSRVWGPQLDLVGVLSSSPRLAGPRCRNHSCFESIGGGPSALGRLEIYRSVTRFSPPWNHKRIYRIYRQLRLNQSRRTKLRLLARSSLPVFVPEGPNEVWSADFMSDTLYHGSWFRTFNLIDDLNREALAIEIDTSLRAERVIWVLDRLKADRELPHMIRVDNGPEFLTQALQDWGKANHVLIFYMQPGRPTQNAFIERFNRTYRTEVLNLYLFRSLEEVREITAEWMTIYNEHRPHEALQGATPWKPMLENSTLPLSACRGSLHP